MRSRLFLGALACVASAGVAHGQSLTTEVPPNNGSGGVWFDLTDMTEPGQGLEIHQIDVGGIDGAPGTDVEIEVWIYPGTYIEHKNERWGWSNTERIVVTRQGPTTPVELSLEVPILVPDGETVGVYLQAIANDGIRFFGNVNFTPQGTYTNDDLRLYSEHATTAGNSFGIGTTSPRAFSGTVHYRQVPADKAVLPVQYADLPGTGGLNSLTAAVDRPWTYQVQFSEAQLAAQGIWPGVEITGITWRSMARTGNPSSWPSSGGATWSNYEITFAEAANAVGSMSSEFATNMRRPVQVRSGELHIPAGTFSSSGHSLTEPNDWGFEIPIEPYSYRGGDLVVLYRHTGGDISRGYFLDRVDSSNAWGQAVSASSSDATSGNVGVSVIITRFSRNDAETIISNQQAATGLGEDFGGSSNNSYKAFGFTMGDETFELDSAVISLDTGPGVPAPVVSIWSGANAPASELMVLENPVSIPFANEYVFRAPSTLELEAGQTYWLHVRADQFNPGGRFTWLGTWPDTMPTGRHAEAVGYLLNGAQTSFPARLRILGTREAEPPCIADWNGDGEVDVNDFFAYLSDFESGDLRADLNNDGEIDINDFFIFLQEFEAGC